jgi:predicted nucleic acid-binding protein
VAAAVEAGGAVLYSDVMQQRLRVTSSSQTCHPFLA